MKVQLPFDESVIELDVPDKHFIGSLVAEQLPPVGDDAVWKALQEPIGTEPLNELARDKKNACVVISDFTRPVPNRAILEPVLGILEDAGMRDGDILILVAAGSHPSVPDDIIGRMVGDKILGRYEILQHDSRDPDMLVPIDTFDGAQLGINKRYVDAELKIITGLIEPHVFAGYSGGPKAVCPGLTSLEAITCLHGPELVDHPKSRAGVMEGNPLNKALASCVGKVGVDFLVNVTIDHNRRITGVFAGDYVKAHRIGVEFLEKHIRGYVEEPVDIVLTCGSGYPLDGTLLQSMKGAMAAENIVHDGGTLILCAGGRHGVGSMDMVRLFERFGTWQNCLAHIKSGAEPIPEQWIMHVVSRLCSRATIKAHVPGVDDRTLETCWLEPVSSAQIALDEVLRVYGEKARVAALPQGSYVLADVRNS